MSMMLSPACSMRLAKHQPAFQSATSRIRSRVVPLQATKGFGTESQSKQSESDGEAAKKPTGSQDYAIEALEARMRSRRAKRIEPQVKVESDAVDAVQGKNGITPQQEAEGNYVLAMLFLFGVVILEGLVIAGSGFLPEDWDAFVQDALYPNYTGTVFLFLAASSLYGLWKIGKIELPFLGTAPPEKTD